MTTGRIHSPHIALNAHLLSGEASYRSAGIHGYLYNTLLQLPASAPDMQFTLLTGPDAPATSAAYREMRARLNTHNPLTRIAWEQLVAPFILAGIRPDLFHGLAFSLPFLWTGPSVVTIFDLSFIRHPGRLSASRRLYLRTVVGVSARRARRIVAISASTQQEIATLLHVPTEKIDIALPGVNSDYVPLPTEQVNEFRRQQGLPSRFILYLGTLEPRKNLPTLIRAYADLPQRDSVKLVLAGGKGWGYEPVYALIEELGLQNDVITPGYIPGNLLPMWYNAAEIFVYPSLYEGFGMPLVEAMACGTTVVASNTTSLPEAVGQAGILVPPDEPRAWTDAISRLLDDARLQEKLAESGRKHAATFAWTETAHRTAETYRKALQPIHSL